MKLKILFVFLLFISLATVKAQIKIGDNPQNINASSVLELESTTRTLVITRVNSFQMNNIVPLQGALVYNVEEQCVYYFDGIAWKNLCEGITASANISLVDNGDGTFTFTNAANVTTEILTTTNVSLTIVGDELVLTDSNNDIVSVTLEELASQTFSTDPIYNEISNDSTIVLTQTGNNYNFEVGKITGQNIVDSSINGFLDIQPGSITDLQLQTDAVGMDEMQDNAIGSLEIIDGSIEEVDISPGSNFQVLRTNGTGVVEWDTLDFSSITGQDLTAGDASITVNAGVGATLVNADVRVATGGITNAKLATDAVDNSKLTDDAVQTENILDGAVRTNDIADDNVTVAKIANGTANQVLKTNAAGTNVEWGVLDANSITGEDLTPGDGSITVNNGTGATLIDSNIIVTDGGITNIKLGADAVDNSKLNDNAVQTENILDGAVRTNDIADDNVTVAKIANGLDGQVLKTVGTAVTWVNPSVIAMGRVTGGGNNLNGITSVIDNTGGNYTVTLANAIPGADYIIQLSLFSAVGNPRTIQVVNQLAGSFDIQIYNELGNTADSDWYFTVLYF